MTKNCKKHDIEKVSVPHKRWGSVMRCPTCMEIIRLRHAIKDSIREKNQQLHQVNQQIRQIKEWAKTARQRKMDIIREALDTKDNLEFKLYSVKSGDLSVMSLPDKIEKKENGGGENGKKEVLHQ